MIPERILGYLVAFVSGAASMAFQMLGSRILAPDFGSSIFVWGSLISVFLGALSLGYMLGGILSDRSHSPILLGILVFVPALLILTFPWYAPPITGAVFEMELGPRSGPLLASTALFLLPTIFFGAVGPYVVGMLSDPVHGAGRRAGDVFAVATIGSILGTLGTAYYLILKLGVNASLMTIGLTLLLLALVAFVAGMARRSKAE